MTAYGDTVGDAFRSFTMMMAAKEEARRRQEEERRKEREKGKDQSREDSKQKEQNDRQDKLNREIFKQRSTERAEDKANRLAETAAANKFALDFEDRRSNEQSGIRAIQAQEREQAEFLRKQEIEDFNFGLAHNRAVSQKDYVGRMMPEIPRLQGIITENSNAIPLNKKGVMEPQNARQQQWMAELKTAQSQLDEINKTINTGHRDMEEYAGKFGYTYDPKTFKVSRPPKGYEAEMIRNAPQSAPATPAAPMGSGAGAGQGGGGAGMLDMLRNLPNLLKLRDEAARMASGGGEEEFVPPAGSIGDILSRRGMGAGSVSGQSFAPQPNSISPYDAFQIWKQRQGR